MRTTWKASFRASQTSSQACFPGLAPPGLAQRGRAQGVALDEIGCECAGAVVVALDRPDDVFDRGFGGARDKGQETEAAGYAPGQLHGSRPRLEVVMRLSGSRRTRPS